MAVQPMLTDRAIQIIAENKIRAAIEAGEFDNLPGLGQPASIVDEPYDPCWWIRRKLRHEQLSHTHTASLTTIITASDKQ